MFGKINKVVNAQEVARLANVSQSTVSRVFNKNWKGPLSDSTRKRVMDVAEELGYVPNYIATVLSSDRSGIIGVVLPSDYHEIFYAVLSMLTKILTEKGYKTMVFTTSPLEDVDVLWNQIIQYRVDGVIVTSGAISHRLTNGWKKHHIPVVLYNGYIHGLNVSAVQTDNMAAGHMMAEYLVKAGHQRFCFLSSENSVFHNYSPRQDGFLDGLRRQGIDDCTIVPGAYTYESGLEAAREIFSMEQRPDAIFCCGEFNALAMVDYAKELGIAVGTEVSICGFDSIIASKLPAYGLSAIVQPLDILAKDAVQLLEEKIADNDSPAKVIIRPPTLDIRKTSRPV